MSQEFFDPELFADFIAEAKEHLETIEPNLLELEKAPGNLALLNDIFRPMHSLKGASGFLGLNRINQLAHKSESILDELRKGTMVVTSEIMDVILASTDALRQMIDNLESSNTEGEVPYEHIMAQIDAIMRGETTAPAEGAAEEGAGEPAEAETVAVGEASTEAPAEAVEEGSAEEPAAAEGALVEGADAGTSEEAPARPVAEDAQSAEPEAGKAEEAVARPEEPVAEKPEETAPEPPAPVAEAPAQPAAPARQSNGALSMSAKEWFASIPKGATYNLTAFGEGHLKDFIDEAYELIENLTAGLLQLEEQPVGQEELINDLFRYFHNLKGNSGIIGYNEFNALTHEAETLLNNLRQGNMAPSRELIDLLLMVVDILESLVQLINVGTCSVRVVDISPAVRQLKAALTGGPIALPVEMRGGQAADVQEKPAAAEPPKAQEPAAAVEAKEPEEPVAAVEAPKPEEPVAAAEAPKPEETSAAEATPPAGDRPGVTPVAPVIIPIGTEGDDAEVFAVTVGQQLEIIAAALETLKKDGTNKESIDALHRCLMAIKNASGYVGLEEIKVYAERTAGIVDQGRKTGLDFEMMVDLLSQEVAIIGDMVKKALDEHKVVGTSGQGEAKPATAGEAPAAPKSEPKAAEAPKPAVEAPKAAEEAPKPAAPAAPAAKPAPAAPTTSAPKAAADAAKPAAAPKPAAPAAAAAKPAATAPHPATPATPAAPHDDHPGAAPAAAGGAAPAAAGAPGADHKGSSTIRVDHERLDHLMNLIGELIINRNRYTMIARSLEADPHTIDITQVAQSLSETTYAMARISDDLQDTIMKVRMVPVSSVFSRFPRLVRDLSRKSGKEVDLIMEGEETELDKSVVEVIGDPLVHLIRNSVDHGIEAEDVRIAAGKPPKGKVVLRAFHKGNSVAIEIEDDGKGIDPEKMREVAVKKGVISADEAANLDDREAVELIFAPGFSSAEKVTEISGRGVGMDVVRTNIKNLKGSVSTYSEVGKGTRFTLSLPLTLAIIDALMINVSGQMYAIPLDAVSETTKIEADRLTDIKGRKAVTLRGEVLGIVDLSEMLALPRAEKLPDVLSIVVIHDNERRLGLVVDRLLERQEIVIKPLGAYLGDLRGISGATIMGDGSVILILDPHEIYSMATSKSSGLGSGPSGGGQSSAIAIGDATPKVQTPRAAQTVRGATG